jgi:hypothetical protein
MATKKWVAPELIVLVRSNPEEAVLTACKYVASIETSNMTTFSSCRQDQDPPANCNFPCDALVST